MKPIRVNLDKAIPALFIAVLLLAYGFAGRDVEEAQRITRGAK